MRKGAFVLAMVFGLSGLILPATNSVQGAPIVLKMGNVLPPTDPAGVACEQMIKVVDEKSKGRLKIQFFPSSQLGNSVTQAESTMLGSQEMGNDAVEQMSTFEKDYNILALPFAFRDQNHLQSFLKSPLHTEIKERFRKNRGIRILSSNWDRNPRVVLAKKPVYSPKDLEGAKMRVPEIEMYFRAWKAMGARPMQTPASEIYLALMQGVVDAMEGPLNAIFSLKLHEAAKNITVTNHLLSALCIYVNDSKFQSLDKELQDILVEAAEEGGRVYTKLGIDNYDRDKKEMEAKGVKFITVDVKPFQEKMKPLISDVEAEGKWTKGLYEKIQNIK